MQMLYKYYVLERTRNFEHICFFLDTHWIIVTGISAFAISCIAICACVVKGANAMCQEKKQSNQRLSAAINNISVFEFVPIENVKLMTVFFCT